KYRTLGMELMDILRAVTAVPARIMGMEGKIGTLKPGADADIVILKQKDLSFTQKDFRDEELTSHELLVPQMTMCAGEINFCQSDFFL
ncbi:amidohydrolase family protein, partial [Enterocloster citroniae]|nr:amidohydrolase family protein [Enterocloster citroniae]